MKHTAAILLCAIAIASAVPRAAADPAPKPASQDQTSYLDNGHIRIGIDLERGGSITYLSKSGSEVNLVNSSDMGRQIQMSFYSGPIPFVPPGTRVSPGWTTLGWNPIQTGDAFGNRSRVLTWRNDGKTLYVKSIPMQWPLNNVPGECVFQSWITLDGSTAHVRSQINLKRGDHRQYGARLQELPAIYTNGPWGKLMTYQGDKPFTGGALTQAPPIFPWTNWDSTENWTALVDDHDWGLGIWEPGTYLFGGGFFGPPGVGGPTDGSCGYMAPVYIEVLDHHQPYSYSYVLILGSLDDIRRYVYAHAQRPKPPEYRFQADRQHWYYSGASDTGWPIKGALHMLPAQSDPQMIGPESFWLAKEAPMLTIRAAYHTVKTHPTRHSTAQVFWKRADDPKFSESKSMKFPLIGDGKVRDYKVRLAASPKYHGAITGLRFDPEPNGQRGDSVDVQFISLRR